MEGKLHPAQIWLYLTGGLVVGFVVGLWTVLTWQLGLAALAAAGGVIIFIPRLRPLSLVAVGIIAALLRGNDILVSPAPSSFIGPQQFVAQITAPPRLSKNTVRYFATLPNQPTLGQVLLITRPEPRFNYGETVQVICRQVEVVDFEGYLNQGIWRQCAWPEIKLLKVAPLSFKSWLLQLRQQAGQRLRTLLPEPPASLASGMLWGDDSGLQPEVVTAFRRTGTSHLLAVSGYNVMILTEIMFWLLISLGLWQRLASFIVLGLIGSFVMFTGAEPSVVRAGVMGSLVLLARLLARRPDEVNVLLGAAAAILLVSPSLVRDLGFQLSFGAMAGLMLVSPHLKTRLNFIPTWLGLRESAIQTLGATATTLPIILWRLGQISWLSPVANLLVAPAVVWVFVFGLASLLLSFIGTFLAVPAAWALTAVLTYVIKVIAGLANLPLAASQSSASVWLGVALIYGLFIWRLKFKPVTS